MTIDEGLKELAGQCYTRQVDVVQNVMAQVAEHPYMQPRRQKVDLKRVLTFAVAATVALLLVNVVVVNTRSYDEDGIGYMIAQVSDYSYHGSTVEEYAVNPIDYLYDE